MKERTIVKKQHTEQKSIINILIQLKNNGKADNTIKWIDKALTLMKQYANLNDPETIKQFIANRPVSNGTKKNYVIAYNNYAKFYKIKWEMPKYRNNARIRKIPTTEKLEMLIATASPRLSLKLSISKETGLRPTELMNLKVKDIDTDQRTIYPTTAKNGLARKLKISTKLQILIQNHINKNKLDPNTKLFKGTPELYAQYYRKMRNHLANKINDQSIKTIRLYDFRHYFATKLYAKTRDILYVKQQLGHRSIESTLVYTQLLDLKDDEWTCRTATNITQATQLIENGFQYVTEIDGIRIFRKRK